MSPRLLPNFFRIAGLTLLFAVTARARTPLVAVQARTATAEEVTAARAEAAKPATEMTGFEAARFAPVAGARQDGVFLMVATERAGGAVVLLRREAKGGWTRRAPPPGPVLGAALAMGQTHVFFLGEAGAGRLRLLAYHTITDTWAALGEFAAAAGDGVELLPAKDGFIVAPRAGAATRVELTSTKRSVGWIDWTIIVVYLVGTAGIGLYFYLKEKKGDNTEFFLGGRSIPWWAAGVSLYATGTSAISFIAIPAKSFATNWLYLCANVIGLIGISAVALWVVPLIRRLDLTSVYHYLELRFHPNIRVLSSALNIVLQLGGRMSVVLFLPSLAMAAVTGVGVKESILIMGVVTILYTVMGGMKAVIWTDFIQVFVMLGGAFFAIGYIIAQLDGGVGTFFAVAAAEDKFKTFDWSLDLTKATVWGFLASQILNVLVWPQDQVMTQRVLSTKNDKEAGWSVWTLGAFIVPGALTFFAIGTALFVFYKQHPERLNPLLPTDSTFPVFIAGELPVGVVGLIIAGIFAASMSTLSSCINSVATLVSVDFYERYAKNPTPAKSVRLAEWMTVIGGVIGVGTALLLATIDIKSALDRSFELMALLGGGFAGCYGLGMFTRRANWQGAAIGVGCSLVVTFVAWTMSLVHPYFYLPIATGTCLGVGWAASWCFPPPAQSLAGLTVFTPKLSAPHP